jgi:alkanesulfonate monooxygenase SsuD/methylene tetrahydromethanopterin reductase-like flavin-dependent oxidoreductase (luciferase family)
MILDLHIHTSWHSADSNLSPIELIREAKRLGLDGVVVTEHDRGWDRFRARELAAEYDFLFLRGMEVSTDLGHILVCGLEEYVSGIQRAEKLRQVVDDVGGIMIAAHPFRRAFTPDFHHGKEPTPLTLAEAARRPIFALAIPKASRESSTRSVMALYCLAFATTRVRLGLGPFRP